MQVWVNCTKQDREEPQHTNAGGHPCRPDRTRQVAGQEGAATHIYTCCQPCRPDHTWQVAGQGGAATHTYTHMLPTLLARPHLAGHWSGRSRNKLKVYTQHKLTSHLDAILHLRRHELL